VTDRLTANSLLTTAESYAMAAGVVWEQVGRFNRRAARRDKRLAYNAPIYHLHGQSVEVALKAFLRSRGASDDYLSRKIKHNLHKALRRAEAKGLLVNLDDRQCVVFDELAERHGDHSFRYPETGLARRLPIHDVAALTQTIIAAVKPHVRPRRVAG
jgi:hypothetical protein